MNCDFYVIKGKKQDGYKPSLEHYERAFIRFCEKIVSDRNVVFEEQDKLVYLMVKMVGKRRKSIRNGENVYETFEQMNLLNDLIGRYTPREFMRLFPLTKEHDGGCWKDYNYCMEYINKFGVDTKIGNRATEFLMEYQNWDITFYALAMMHVISEISIIENGTDPFEEALEEIGIHPKTMYRDGDYLVDIETGERHKICNHKNPMRKLFGVIE